MTKKNNKQKKIDETKELEQELQAELENNKISELKEQINKLTKEKEKLERKLKEQEEITKNTQLQYITLKNDFNLFTNRVKENESKLKDELFENIILKTLPIIEMMMISYDTLPEEFKDHKWSEGLSILNKKLKSFLEDLEIEVIPTV
jgi:molecular chaperone GrpE (heat shock protein)